VGDTNQGWAGVVCLSTGVGSAGTGLSINLADVGVTQIADQFAVPDECLQAPAISQTNEELSNSRSVADSRDLHRMSAIS
jgi:hypothetical protein